MSASRPRSILKVALAAAEKATFDSDEGATSVKQLGLLNEQWAQSYVGHAISRHLQQAYEIEDSWPLVTYETSAAWIDYFVPERSPGPYATGLGDKSRFDLTVWHKNRTIEGLVEIKDQPVMEQYSKSRDPGKLVAALRRWPTIKWGIFLYSVRATDHYDDDKMNQHLSAKIDRVDSAVQVIDKRFKVAFDRLNPQARSTKCVMWSGAIIRRQDDYY